MVCGFDLASNEHQDYVIAYIEKCRPFVIVLGPPPLCTGFGRWSHLNKYIHPETWSNTRNVGECLVSFAARLCQPQPSATRHFLVENFAGSELIPLACFNAIWETDECAKVNVPQCALGLVAYGEPTYKNITRLASITLLLEPFRGLKCTCSSHGTLSGYSGGTAGGKFAQVWLREMRQRICIGLRILTRQRVRQYYVELYPVGRGRGRPRMVPEGTVSKEGFIYDCFVCMRRLHKRHLAHTRNGEPPLFCKHCRFEQYNWSCDVCLRVGPP